MRPFATACLLACAAAACTPEPPPPRDAGPALGAESLPGEAVPQPDGGMPDAGGATPASPAATGLPLVAAEAVLPDGSTVPLARDGVTTVEPSSRFRVEVGGRLPDARLALLDAQDAMVPADGTVEVAASTRFALTPTAPLRPGTIYALRLEGAEGRLLRSEDGGSYEPVSLALRTSGAAPAPPRKAKRRRAR